MQTAGDWLLKGLARFNRFVTSAEDISGRDGLLQDMDPRFKAACAVILIVAAVFVKAAAPILVILAAAEIAASASRVTFGSVFGWIWIPVLTFSGSIAFPAIFTTPGDTIATLPVLGWGIQRQGVNAAVMLVLRAEAAATVSALVALTTPWITLLKALRAFRVPAVFIVILGTTHRYLFLLLRTAAEMSEARRSRSVGPLEPLEQRRIANATIGVLLSKSVQWSDEVHLAMMSRGFRGDVFVLDESQAKTSDWLLLAVTVGLVGFLGMTFG